MTTPAVDFERELEIFRKEVEEGTQFFYADLAVHGAARRSRQVSEFLNRAPLFWNTCLGALQTGVFVALGRIFDQRTAHNLYKVLSIAQKHPQIFSKAELGRRKQGNNTSPEWLPAYLLDVYEPTPMDFRRLKSHVRKRRRIYESNYRDLRNKVFAHNAASDDAEVAVLFGKTDIRELQQLFAFLLSLHEALWQLFFNGRKPVLRPLRYSVKRMRDLPSPSKRPRTLQERITFEAKRLLMSASRVAERRVP